MHKHLFDIFVSWHVLNCLLSPHFDHAIGLIVLVLSDSICESIRLYSFAKSIRKDSFWEKKRKFNSFFFTQASIDFLVKASYEFRQYLKKIPTVLYSGRQSIHIRHIAITV